jgi:hypothetical protein
MFYAVHSQQPSILEDWLHPQLEARPSNTLATSLTRIYEYSFIYLLVSFGNNLGLKTERRLTRDVILQMLGSMEEYYVETFQVFPSRTLEIRTINTTY